MHARIAATTALLSMALLVAPALADECPLVNGSITGCQEQNPQPEPEPQPQPQPPSEPQQPQPEPQPEYGPAAHRPAAVSRLLDLMNGERRRAGLSLFALRGDVSGIAARHSEAMAARGTIWHNDGYFTEATRRKLDARLLGENVARNPEIDDAHRRLMNSPGHRANILDGRFTVVGLAVYHDGQGNLYVTQNFVEPNSRPAPPSAPATPAPTPTAAGKRAPQAPTTTQLPAPSVAATPAPAPEPAPAVVMGEVSEPPADTIAPPASTEAPAEQGTGPAALMALAALLLALTLVVARVVRRRSTDGRAGGPVVPVPAVAVPDSRFLPFLSGLRSIFPTE